MAIIDKIKQVIADEYGTRQMIDHMVFVSNLVMYDIDNEGGSLIGETEIGDGATSFKITTVDGLRVHPQRPGVDDLIEIRFAYRDDSGEIRGVVITMNYQDTFALPMILSRREWDIQRTESSI
ncbi:hypothetical protein B2I21_08815 [Chryseobacterium mucoviscidosis]|nr:hypothetical protein B2I21_08815 [Chryseobacterium mucoviscidosis]